MEWTLTVNSMLTEEITKVGPNLLPEGFHGDVMTVRAMQECLGRLIDGLGEQSAAAQGLSKVITTAEKLRNASHVLYLLKEITDNGGKGDVIGLLKIGQKHLYLFDEQNASHEVEPVCVLDFYIRGDRQRKGLGKKLFDRMLQDEGLEAYQLAIDGPSAKMEQFLCKNYGLERLIKQNNNYAVSPHFFKKIETGQSGLMTVPAPVGRFAAPKSPSTIATVIHRGGRSPQHPSDATAFEKSPRTRSGSRVATPNVNLSEKAPAAPPAKNPPEPEPKPEPEVPKKTSPERPTTLHVDTTSLPEKETRAVSPAGSALSRRDSQLTERGYFDVKFYHSKLW